VELLTTISGFKMKKHLSSYDTRKRNTYQDQPPVPHPRRYSVGSKVYVASYAGPVVEVTVTTITPGGFEGTINENDNIKLVAAGVPNAEPDQIRSCGDHEVVSVEEYYRDNPANWVVKENYQKFEMKGVHSQSGDYIHKPGKGTRKERKKNDALRNSN